MQCTHLYVWASKIIVLCFAAHTERCSLLGLGPFGQISVSQVMRELLLVGKNYGRKDKNVWRITDLKVFFFFFGLCTAPLGALPIFRGHNNVFCITPSHIAGVPEVVTPKSDRLDESEIT